MKSCLTAAKPFQACVEMPDKTRMYEVPFRMEGKEVIRPTLHITQDEPSTWGWGLSTHKR